MSRAPKKVSRLADTLAVLADPNSPVGRAARPRAPAKKYLDEDDYQKCAPQLYTWETFLRVAPRTDLAPAADAAWLIARGIDPGAPTVLRLLRDEVLPLVRALETRFPLDTKDDFRLKWYSFLIHDNASGVPTTADDKAAYIHLRLGFPAQLAAPELPPQWTMTRRCEKLLQEKVCGLELDSTVAWNLLGAQAAWILSVIEQHGAGADGDILTLVKNARQLLHFFANALQMRVA